MGSTQVAGICVVKSEAGRGSPFGISEFIAQDCDPVHGATARKQLLQLLRRGRVVNLSFSVMRIVISGVASICQRKEK